MKHIYACLFILLISCFAKAYAQSALPCSTAVVVNMPDTVLPYNSKATDSMRWLTAGWYKLVIPAGKGIKGFVMYAPGNQYPACSTATQDVSGTIYKGDPCDSVRNILFKALHHCFLNPLNEWYEYIWELALIDSVSDGDIYYLSINAPTFGLKYLPRVVDTPSCANADTIPAFPFSGTNLCKAPLDEQNYHGYSAPLALHVFFPTSDTVNLTITFTSFYTTGYSKFLLFRDCAHVGDYTLDTTGHYKYLLDSAELGNFFPLPAFINLHTTRAVAGMPLTLVVYSNYGGFESAFGNSMFTYDIMGTGVVMPISLAAFNAYYNKQQNAVSLSWIAEGEQSTKFIIERSDDGKHYRAIGEVNETGTNNYSYLDKSPLAPKMFYRLKLLNEDGEYSYSETKVVTTETNIATAIYPNPAHGLVNALFNANIAQQADITILDATGRTVLAQKQTLLEGSNSIAINIAALARGIYFMKMRMENGEEVLKKLIIQ